MDKLLPCPFCGSKATYYDKEKTYACCRDEYCPMWDHMPVENWNTRPPQQRCAVEWPEKRKSYRPFLDQSTQSTEADDAWNYAIDACITAYNAVHGSEREGG